IERYREFVERAADIVVGYGGSLSGEHGDGQARGELLTKMFGPELVQAFREFKAIWDPDGKMNPGKVVDARPLDADLKLGPDYEPPRVETAFAFPSDGGSFARATLRCQGIGKCRKLDTGTMCPSYMVLREEKHTTRGRAPALRDAPGRSGRERVARPERQGGARPVPRLQGVQARVSGQRGHGHVQGRVP